MCTLRDLADWIKLVCDLACLAYLGYRLVSRHRHPIPKGNAPASLGITAAYLNRRRASRTPVERSVFDLLSPLRVRSGDPPEFRLLLGLAAISG